MSWRRTSGELESWQLPPVRSVARPTVHAAVAASDRVRAGLAGEWRQRELRAGHLDVTDVDLVLLEVVAGEVPGLTAEDLAELVAAVATGAVPLVLWVTAGEPGSVAGPLLTAATEVFVAEDLEVWQAHLPRARLLPPAASPRIHRPGLPRRPEAVLIAAESTHAELGGPVAALVAPALAPLADAVTVHRAEASLPPAGALPRALAARTVAVPCRQSVEAVRSASVLVDGPRRTPGDSWAVLEAAAAQTPVVTVPGALLPEGLDAPVATSAAAVRGEVVARIQQPELRDREGLRQQRAVFAGHTYRQRVDTLLATLGRPLEVAVEHDLKRTTPSVSAIAPTNRTHELDNVFANVARQAHTATELVLVLHGIDLPDAELQARAAAAGVPHLTTVRADSSLTLGACLNLGIEAASGEWLAKLDDDNLYGAHYLTDLLNAAESSGAGILGKWAHYVWLRSTGAVVLRYPDAEHTWQRRIQGGSMIFAGDVARELRFSDIPRAVDSDVLDRAIAAGVKIWSADRFNFVSVRGDDRAAHTWTVADATFLTASGRLVFHGDPRAHVEV